METLDELEPLLIRQAALSSPMRAAPRWRSSEGRAHLRDAHFVGGHPMAGKEERGVEAADADCSGRPWILTSPSDQPVVREFLE